MNFMGCVMALAIGVCGSFENSWAAEPLNSPPSGGVTSGNGEPAAQGRILFERNCAHCHGDDAKGDEGPSLYNLRKGDGRIRQTILQGIRGEMPKFLSKFKDAEVTALIAYLRTLKS